ncbi:MAG: ABC transporter substrate-binding protein [Muribaculum sp.]|nr:ABC transporter substrate-binding protein [Muribaculum sp.]
MMTILLLLNASCSSGKGDSSAASGSDTVKIEYASNLKIEEYDGFTKVTLADPWHEGKILQTYLLVDKDAELPGNLPEGVVVRTPLSRAVLGTTVHASLLYELGADGAIAGICDVDYINQPDLKKRVANGSLINCGSSMSPDIEAIMDLQPDAVLLSPYETSGSFGKTGNLGIPIIQLADYMEAGPLARAEWVKFYGRLFGAAQKADSIFSKTAERYNNLKAIVDAAPKSGDVLANKMMESTWYIPAGNSTIGMLISDANSSYAWSDTKQEGAIALPYETVLDKAGDAPLWIITYNSPSDLTYEGLLKENPRYSQFRAFKERNIYGCNTNGTLYYEETPFHPDRLLHDFIIMSHPGLTDETLTYFKPLSE